MIDLFKNLFGVAEFIVSNKGIFLIFIASLLGYFVLIFLMKFLHLVFYVDISFKCFWRELCKNSSKLYSVDYYSASVFKSLCSLGLELIPKKMCNTMFVKAWNKYNLVISIMAMIVVFFVAEYYLLPHWLFFLVYIRFFSRALEIFIAFVSDVFQSREERNTFLRKNDRIILAGKSYLEIYVLSATVYVTLLPNAKLSWLEAIYQSLNVGTLTNVAGAQEALNYTNVLIFTQVLATMSLVVLSFATYLSHKR